MSIFCRLPVVLREVNFLKEPSSVVKMPNQVKLPLCTQIFYYCSFYLKMFIFLVSVSFLSEK